MLNNLTELSISPRLAKNIRRNVKERVIEFILMMAALSAVFTTFAIVAILLYESFGFFETVSLVEFFTGTEWTPLFEDAHYGIMPLIAGTLTTSFVALAVAVPVGTIAAIYLSEFASHKTREITKPILELLVGVLPSPLVTSPCCLSPHCCRSFFQICRALTCSVPAW